MTAGLSQAVRNEYAQEYANVRDKLLPAVAKLQDRGVEKYLEVVQVRRTRVLAYRSH